MALNFLLKRSGTANKRPDPASMALGELDLNYDAVSGGVFYKDSAGDVVKVGSAQVSATAPNATPAGSAGNSDGEFWYDTANSELKLWDGTAWISTGGGSVVAGVTGTAPVAVDNTDPANPVISVDTASTIATGVVQLNDTTTSTSTTEAATANAAKTAYDAGIQGQTDAATAQVTADAAMPKSGGTFEGSVTFAASAVGGTILTLDNLVSGDGYGFGSYDNEPLTGGTGTGATANINVGFRGGVSDVTLVDGGTGYTVGDSLSAFGFAFDPWSIEVASVTAGSIRTVTLNSGTEVYGDFTFNTSPTFPAGVDIGAAEQVTYDNAVSGLTATDVQGAIDEVAAGSGGTPEATPTTLGTLFGLSGSVANNTSVGLNALCSSTTGCLNVAVGVDSARLLTTGRCNTAVGYQAQASAVSSRNNVAFGYQALCTAQSGNSNVAIGMCSLFSSVFGYSNVAVGCCAGFALDAGAENTLIGDGAGSSITTGNRNIVIGSRVEVADGTASEQLAIGFNLNRWLTGDSTYAIKPGNGVIDCAGSCGTVGQVLMSTGSNAICWGTAGGGSGTVTSITAGAGLTGGTITTSGTIDINFTEVLSPAEFTASGQLLVGAGDATYTALAVGSNAQVLTADSACTGGVKWAAGGGGGASPATISARGTVYGATPSDFVSNTAFGYQAGQNATGTGGIFIGPYVMGVCTGTGNGVIAIGGDTALRFPGAENQLVIQNSQGGNSYYLRAWCSGGACFFQPGGGLVDSNGNGPVAGRILTGTSSSAQAWCAPSFVGCSLYSAKGTIVASTGANLPSSLAVGTDGQVLTADSACTTGLKWAAGGGGGASPATPTVAGTVLGCTVDSNTALGCNAFLSNTGSCITGIGCDALSCNTTGVANTALGYSALCLNTTALANTAVGGRALRQVTSGDYNSAHGAFTLQANIVGTHNSAFGACALYTATGSCNTALGWLAGCQLTSGSNNVLIGPDVQAPSATDSCQLVIGFSATDNWLTGNSTKAIKPGAGIIDAVNSSGTGGQVLTSSGFNQIQWKTINTFQTAGITGNIPAGGGAAATSFGPPLNSLNFVGVVYVTLNVVDTVTSAVYNYLYNGMMYAEGSTPWTMSELSAKTLDSSGGAFTVLLDYDTGYQYKPRLTVTNNTANILSLNGKINWANLSGDFV